MKIFKTAILALSVIFGSKAYSQVTTEQKDKQVEVKLSGFIMNNFFYDTRKNFEALDGMLLLWPLPLDTAKASGKDLNDVDNLSFLSFASRLKTIITGLDALGAKTSAYIEYDFTARANSATVRFRQAWVKLNWEKTELLTGRTWHPMVVPDVTPSVNALSWGAPFQPFNRSDQIALTQKIGPLNLILAAVFQNDYVNNGPLGKTAAYQTNAIIPNLHAQIKYKSDALTYGIGLDFKRLKPRNFTVSPITGKKYTTNVTINCPAFLAYGQFKTGKFLVSSKAIFAQNISESTMPGGFGISQFDSITGHEEYTPYKHFFLWGNTMYGDKLKVGLFAGYLKNLGASKNLINSSPVWSIGGSAENIENMVRIVPILTYTSGKVTLASEIEHNIVSYGAIDFADKGKIKNTYKVKGTRFLATIYYFF